MLRKRWHFQKQCGENWKSTCREIKYGPYLLFCTKPNPKWAKDLKVKLETLKLLKENIGITISKNGVETDFLTINPFA